jgi:hypothetical protein
MTSAFGQRYDNFSSAIKARRAGFVDCIDTEDIDTEDIDTEDMFMEFFAELRMERATP